MVVGTIRPSKGGGEREGGREGGGSGEGEEGRSKSNDCRAYPMQHSIFLILYWINNTFQKKKKVNAHDCKAQYIHLYLFTSMFQAS